MIIRFIAKNIFSFKEETEFNLLPDKTQQRLQHHKVAVGEFDILRFSALYGANGSGKSNLVRCIALMEKMVVEGKLLPDHNSPKFKLDVANAGMPVSLAMEFVTGSQPYYYTISFDRGRILKEYLAESSANKDVLIFERSLEGDRQKIQFFPSYYKTDKEKQFVEILSEKVIGNDELLLTFLSKKYPEEFNSVYSAYQWFAEMLMIISPDAGPEGGIAHILDKETAIMEFANRFIPTINTGIAGLEIEKRKIEEGIENEAGFKHAKAFLDERKGQPGKAIRVSNFETGDEFSIVYEGDELIAKRLITKHSNKSEDKVVFTIGEESDGTKRIIEYVPVLQRIISESAVIIIDEIERSIHPLSIKEIITKLTLDDSVKGQLIFTTHESNLLDQRIMRPDEIWFAQKDFNGASRLYSLSDFKIHNTIDVDIENGYLNGRYGAIPFLADLKKLNW